MGNKAWYRHAGLPHIRVVVARNWSSRSYLIVVESYGQEIGRHTYQPERFLDLREIPTSVISQHARRIINRYRELNRS